MEDTIAALTPTYLARLRPGVWVRHHRVVRRLAEISCPIRKQDKRCTIIHLL